MMRRRFLSLLSRMGDLESGQAYVEYVVLGALAVLVILGSLQIFFNSISVLFGRIAQMLSSAF
jgi:Flp pilus assembly pilin Flp